MALIYFLNNYPHEHHLLGPNLNSIDESFMTIIKSELGNKVTNKLDFASKIVVFDYSKKIDKKLNKLNKRNYKFKKILIKTEPESVNYNDYKLKAEEQFDVIIEFGKKREVKYGTYYGLPWPCESEIFKKQAKFDIDKFKLNKAVIVASNYYSFHKNSLYHLRRQVVKNLPNLIDVYGIGWKSYSLKNYRNLFGNLIKSFSINLEPMTDKQRSLIFKSLITPFDKDNRFGYIKFKNEIYNKYKINLVIENSKDYISEKLFESIYTQNPTIYVGPKLKAYGIPENICIQVEPNVKKIEKSIIELLNNPKFAYEIVKNGEKFLLSGEGLKFNKKNIIKQIAKILVNL